MVRLLVAEDEDLQQLPHDEPGALRRRDHLAPAQRPLLHARFRRDGPPRPRGAGADDVPAPRAAHVLLAAAGIVARRAPAARDPRFLSLHTALGRDDDT